MNQKTQTDPLDDMGRIVKRAQLFAARILQRSKGSDIQLKDPSDAAKLLNAIASLSRAATELEKTKMEREGAIRLAARAIWDELYRKWLKSNPGLLREVQLEISREQQEMLQEQYKNPCGAVSGKKERMAITQALPRKDEDIDDC